jgi:large subunit ribosomal protein L4
MGIKLSVYNQKGSAVSEMELSDRIFGVKPNTALIHQVAVALNANSRQVLANTLDRSEVRGGGRKPWRQKGTGRARAGSSRSPIWIGGGVVFGPTKDRNFKKIINKKMRQQAILMVLSDRAQNKSMAILEKLEASEFKTKIMSAMISAIEKNAFNVIMPPKEAKTDKKSKPAVKAKTKVKRSVMILSDNKDDKIKYSLRNLAGVKAVNLENINLLDLLKYRQLIVTAGAVKSLEETYK